MHLKSFWIISCFASWWGHNFDFHFEEFPISNQFSHGRKNLTYIRGKSKKAIFVENMINDKSQLQHQNTTVRLLCR